MHTHERALRAFRWIAVFPLALIGAGALHLILVVAYTTIAGGGEAALAGRLVMRTAVNMVFGAAAVGLAWMLAPSRKHASAVGMAALFALLSTVVWLARLDVGAAWDRYATVVSVAAAILAAGAAQRIAVRTGRAPSARRGVSLQS